MTCIRYGADDPRGPDHGRDVINTALQSAVRALQPLTDEERRRVVRGLVELYGEGKR